VEIQEVSIQVEIQEVSIQVEILVEKHQQNNI
jgi:hypothetical protein